MSENEEKIADLLTRINQLSFKQEQFQFEINQLKFEVSKLKEASQKQPTLKEVKPVVEETKVYHTITPPVTETVTTKTETTPPVLEQRRVISVQKPLIAKEDWEKFIGENLINKIGIIITVIGVAIGAKYAIDHQYISPLMRIIFGYVVGLGLLGFALKLKTKYESFSAVLLSGAMAIMYLITFMAYSLYGLFPQAAAFGLMVMFTVFTVIAAIHYNRQVIAHIGLVGAYAVPFLLSDGSGKVLILYSYMAIINTGILVISFKKYWKSLLYVAFGLTYLIYLSWFVSKYDSATQFRMAFAFLGIYFSIFYAAILSYKLIKKEKFSVEDVMLYMANSFIFFGVGYALLDDTVTGKNLLGLFTLGNAIIHFVVCVIIYRNKLADKNLFYLVSGMVLVFITIAIPVQLDGNWVTLLWAGEAALLFWIGRTKGVVFYELMSYPLMILALGSICQDWSIDYNAYSKQNPAGRITPLLNVHFLSSLLVVAAFGFITFFEKSEKYTAPVGNKHRMQDLYGAVRYGLPAIFVGLLYASFLIEIASYWDQLYIDSGITLPSKDYASMVYNEDLPNFKFIWSVNYTLLFLAVLSVVNIKWLKSRELAFVNLVLNVLSVAVFMTVGLYTLSLLRDTYLSQELAKYYNHGSFNIYLRYLSFAFAATTIYCCYRYMKEEFVNFDLKMHFDLLLYTSILWVASSELINWMCLMRLSQSYKLELSILWGAYALLLIVLGIWKKKKHLRLGAIGLFAVTLVKLFFYDISQLETIAKTIVFVSLGILLLIISFLYNKYKHIIEDEPTV